MNFIKQSIGILFISFLMLTSCSNSEEKQTQRELELKQKELELKEREINLQEKSLTKELKPKAHKEEKQRVKENKKELRYLYYANGGLRGYFDDGTIVGCPRCDFCRSSILAMFDEKPMGTYKVQSDGSLLVNNSEREFPKYNNDNGWALIDYKWNEKVPQY